MTTDKSSKMATITSSPTDIEKNDLITSAEAIIVEEEPVEPSHTCCTRLMCFPASIIAFIPAAAFIVGEIIAAPIVFAILVICKCFVCNFCCPDSIHHCFRNIMCTPCRWFRISYKGKGHIECWNHPAWPFRKT